MKEVATNSDIKNLIVDVSEEIRAKNILKFAHTTLDINDIEYSSKDIIYCNFLEYSNQYQLLIFSNSFKYMIIELLNYEDTISEESSDLLIFKLYISKTFFVVYKNLKLYVYQTLNQEYSKDELLSYIHKNFNINISVVRELDNTKLNKITQSIDINNIVSSFSNINKKNNKNFILYLLYLFICMFCTIIYKNYESDIFKDNQLKKINNDKKEYLKISKKLSFKAFEPDYKKIISSAKKYNLKINSLNYNSKSINIEVSTKKKASIYLFLNEYKDFLLGNSIVKNDSMNIYLSTINVKIN